MSDTTREDRCLRSGGFVRRGVLTKRLLVAAQCLGGGGPGPVACLRPLGQPRPEPPDAVAARAGTERAVVRRRRNRPLRPLAEGAGDALVDIPTVPPSHQKDRKALQVAEVPRELVPRQGTLEVAVPGRITRQTLLVS